jgi:Holliday junction resolvasome RuvABC endonuclease subunit
MTEWVWGLDIAVSHLEFAFADLHSDKIDVASLITKTDAKEGERLGLIDRQVRIYARQMSLQYPPHVVWVEQPSGAVTSPQLMYVAGVTQAALFETLGCPVWTIPSGAWKKAAVGFGNASKAQVSAWCERSGYDFDGQDQADALAIAFAGRRMVQASSWECAA